MSFTKNTLIGLGILAFGSNVYATQWNNTEIDLAKKHAISSLNKFIQQEKTSELYQLLSEKEQKHLRQKMQFGQGSAPSFASLTNKASSLVSVLESFYGHKKIPYAALLLANSGSSVYNDNAIYLYQTILSNDDEGAVYAFQELKKLNLSPDSKPYKTRKQLYRDYGFSLNGINVNNEQTYPKVCINFNKTVRGEPAQEWKKFITVNPAPRVELAYNSSDLCFDGEWQTRYQITVGKNLQSINHLTLNADKSESVNTGMRQPTIRFASSGSILNSENNRHLAISTANVDNVDVELWQIPANNLSNSLVQSIIESPQDVSSWRLGKTLQREGEKHFQGTFKVGDYAPNETTNTNVFFDDMLGKKKTKPGIYVMTASNSDTNGEQSTQIAFSLTNAGFSAYLTDEGLWAELRDLSNIKPIKKQTVTLYAHNNSILGTAVTDSDGVAHFDKPLINGEQGLRPSHIISENDGYFAYLDVNDNPVDLSDKGLSGTITNASLRSWIWSDRGIYRPNDTAHIMWLLKTPEGKPFTNTPIWAELIRPDGKVFADQMIVADKSGAYNFDHYFSNSARQGNWTLRLSLGKKGKVLANKKIPVASVTPQQIETSIEPIQQDINPNDKISLTVKADWLYGAPASDLSTSIQQSISQRSLNNPQWRDWHIGLHDDSRFIDPFSSDSQDTGKDGKTTFSLNVGNVPFSTQPLALKIKATVNEPNGQEVSATYSKDISRTQPYVALQAGKSKSANIALINGKGELQSGDTKWQLFRVNYNYYWYNNNGSWQYQHNESRQLVTSGNVTLDGKKPSNIDLPLDDGAWVLVVRGEQPNVAASIPLEYGRYASPKKDNAPDSITITSDKKRYHDDEDVTIHLSAPFDGKATIKLANNDTIIESYDVNFSDGKAELSFEWDDKWDQGLWLMANAWNEDEKNVHNRRAVGLHWVGGDLQPYTLDLSMDVPETALPKTTLKIPLHLPDSQRGGSTWVRVAAIDDGLYRLAKASFSNPLLAFWEKEQMNVQFFDVWGDIIRQMEARKAALRSGAGDDESSEMSALKALPELDLQLVTFWSKPVEFDSDGNASVSIDLPQFNGRLRVMAAAWSDDRLGAAEQTVDVRAPLVSTLYSPAYLSPGDSSQLRLRLHNTTKHPMTVSAAVNAKGITLYDSNSETISLAPDQVAWVERNFDVSDSASGRATIDVMVGGDQSLTINRFIDVRPASYPIKKQSVTVLKSGSSEEFAVANGGKVFERRLFASTRAPFDPKSILQQLSTYPYGCAEQVTSKAWNNILLANLIPHYQLSEKKWGNSSVREGKLFSAHTKLANYQYQDGGFSLWGYNGSNLWLSAYISEFLLDSQKAKQLGNEAVLERALDYLRNAVMYDNDDASAQAYAHYVLAKSGASVQGASMRFAENIFNKNATPTLSTAHLHTVSALVWHGESSLATRLMDSLSAQPFDAKSYTQYSHYGSGLRNYAQSLSLLYELEKQLDAMNVDGSLKNGTKKAIDTLWKPMRQALATQSYYSTQDLHWLAKLATQLPKGDDRAELLVNNKAVTIEGNTTIAVNANEALTVKNNDNSPVYLTMSDWVIPASDSVEEKGYRIEMRYEDNDGNNVDIRNLQSNQQVYAIATISADKNTDSGDIMFAYPLASGLSELPLSTSNDKADRPWFNQLKPSMFSESRDDRHLSAFSMEAGETFTHVFMLRAARKGTWNAPAYSIENMYQPQFRALYPSPTINVK